MIVRIGFHVECYPAGHAEAYVKGEMDIPSVEDVMGLLHLTITQLRRQIEMERQRLIVERAETGEQKT